MVAEQRFDLCTFVHAQQAMVDKHAGELVANGFVNQNRGDRAIDAARQTANDAAGADLCTDLGDFRRAEFRHGPIAGQPADLVHEVGNQLCAIGRMHNFGVKLDAIILPCFVGDKSIRRAIAGGDNFKARGKASHLVAMAHPHLMLFARLPKAVEQGARLLHLDKGTAKFAAIAFADMAAQLHHHRLLAIANAKNGKAAVEHALRRARGSGVRGGRWTAGQDDALWLHTRERRLCIIEWGDFGIDPRLAHAAGDKLGDLRSEIDDQDGVRRARLSFGFWHAQPIEILARAVQLPPLSLTRYAAHMSKNDTRRAEIIQRLTDYVLAEGLSAASLRPLAKAAGTSDRMLLYYFADKRAIITAVLEQISARLVGLMSEQTASAPLPLEDLRRQLSELLFEDALWPYMRIWLQVAARAAMGDAFYRGVGEQIGRGFLDWGKMQLKADSAAQLEVDAARLLVSMEGMLFLKSIGLDDVNAKAL